MKEKRTYYKNSSTGEILMKQQFSSRLFVTTITFFYDFNEKRIYSPDLNGFVEISEKTFNREARLKSRSLNNSISKLQNL